MKTVSKAKIAANPNLVLEMNTGSYGDLITIKTGSRYRKDIVDQIRVNQADWHSRFSDFHKPEIKIDLAIVVYRDDRYIGKQDVDNIAKVVLDALKGKLFADDKQVVRLIVYKLSTQRVNGFDTNSLSISFRKHDPEKQMVLVDRWSV